MAIRHISGQHTSGTRVVFCRWIYSHLRSKIFSNPLRGGGGAIAPIAPPTMDAPLMAMVAFVSGNGAECGDSDEEDYCNYSLPAAVVMHDDVYGRLVDFKSPTSQKVKLLVRLESGCLRTVYWILASSKHTYIRTYTRLMAFCPGLPG